MAASPIQPASDRDSAPWWAALSRHELKAQQCDECGRLRLPPRELCNACGAPAWTWVSARGTGTVVSWNVTWRTPLADAEVPYVVLLVRLDDQEDLILPGGWAGSQRGDDLRIDLPVRVGFEDVVDDKGGQWSLLRWEAHDDEEMAG